jgi:hypothetical protein
LRSSSSLAAATVPSTGDFTRPTHLPDSMDMKGSPFFTARPTRGASTKTIVPAMSWPNEDIPIVTVSPSTLTQTCSGVYRRSSGNS